VPKATLYHKGQILKIDIFTLEKKIYRLFIENINF